MGDSGHKGEKSKDERTCTVTKTGACRVALDQPFRWGRLPDIRVKSECILNNEIQATLSTIDGLALARLCPDVAGGTISTQPEIIDFSLQEINIILINTVISVLHP